MATAAHLLYATAIAVFLGLSIGFGAVTFFPDPDFPPLDPPPFPFRPNEELTAEERAQQEAFFEEERRRLQAFEAELDDHRRNQLIGVAVLSALIVAVGVAVTALPDALRLGGLLAGMGTMIWAVVHAGDHVGDAAIFATVFAMFLLLASLSHPALRRRVQAVARVSDVDALLAQRRDDAGHGRANGEGP